jgi:hypothetical protein
MCSLDGTCTNVRHVRPSPTILDCPQLSWPTFGVCVPWEVHAPNVRHVRPSPTILSSTILAHLWCKCVPWVVHTECETCETIPNYPGLSSTILAHLWCKCVPWMVHAPNETCERPSPTILDCPPSGPLGCKCVPWVVHARM